MRRIIVGKELEDKVSQKRETCFGIVEKNNKIICLKEELNNSLIGGGIEPGENHIETLQREFEEEAGFVIDEVKELCTIDCNWITKDKVVMKSISNIYIVKISDQTVERQESAEIIKIPIMESPEYFILPYQKIALEEYIKSKDYHYYENVEINGISANIIEPNNEINKVIIYCHGLGSNKNSIDRFYKKLSKRGYAIIAYDAPGHGNDKNLFRDTSFELILDYLEKIINYAKNKYNKEIVLFGSSFGGYTILNYLKNNKYKAVLMCPAFNFGNIVKRKMNIDENTFKKDNYIHLYGNIDITEDNYLRFLKLDNDVQNTNYDNVFIIQGDKDTTVNYKELLLFANTKNIKIKIIADDEHELYKNNKQVVEFILENI